MTGMSINSTNHTKARISYFLVTHVHVVLYEVQPPDIHSGQLTAHSLNALSPLEE